MSSGEDERTSGGAGGEARATIAFVGAPGAGRSTCLRTLAALRVEGEELPAAAPAPNGGTAAHRTPSRAPSGPPAPRLTRLAMPVRPPWSCDTMLLELVVGSAAREPELVATADAIVFVADSDPRRAEQNVHELNALEAALAARGRSLADTPHVLAYNKRDLRVLGPVRELREALNRHGADEVEAAARRGRGVLTALVLAVHALSPRRSRNPAPPLRSAVPSAASPAGSSAPPVVAEKKTS